MPYSATTPLTALATVWIRPRGTMRSLMASPPGAITLAVVVVHAFFKAIDRAVGRSAGEHLSLTNIALLSLAAALLGVPMWYIYAFVVRHTARLLGGNGRPEGVRLALAYGPSPAIVGGLIGTVVAFIGGAEFFKKEGDLPLWFLWILIPTIVLQTVLAIWATVCTSKCVGEACGFSAWCGWASLVIPFAAFLLIVIATIFSLKLDLR